MAKGYVNWKLVIVLAIGSALIVGTAASLRRMRITRSAEAAYRRGIAAYEAQLWHEAASYLGLYLARHSAGPDLWMKYARANLNTRPPGRNEIHQALSALKHILSQDPANRQAAVELAALYLQLQSADAAGVARDFLQHREDPQVRTMLAASLVQQQNYEEAIEHLLAVVESSPSRLEAYQLLAMISFRRPALGERDGDGWIDLAVENNPDSAAARIMQAERRMDLGDISAAGRDAMAATEMDLDDASVRLRLANVLMELGEYEPAGAHLEEALRTDPASVELWRLKASLALKTRSPAEVRQVVEQGLSRLGWQAWDFTPVAAEILIEVGDCRRVGELIATLERGRFDPARVSYLKGMLARRMGRLRESIAHWRSAVEAGHPGAKVRLDLAHALADTGDLHGSMREIRTFLLENPDSFAGRMAATEMCLQTGNWVEAAAAARGALRLRGHSADARLLLAEARLKQLAASGRIETAFVRDIERLLEELESDPRAAFKSGLLRAELAVIRRDYAAARELLAELDARFPGSLEVAIAKANVPLADGNLDEAARLLRDSVNTWPDEPAPVMLLADVLAGSGDYSGAQRLLNSATERFSDPLVRRAFILRLADLHLARQRPGDAADVLQRGLAAAQDDILLRRKLLSVPQVASDAPRARRIVDEIRSLEGDDGWQWKLEQARLSYGSDSFHRDYPRIVELLRENLAANPDDQESRLLLAAACRRAGENHLALALYRDAMLSSPRDNGIVAAAVSMLQEMGEYSEADRLLEVAARLGVDTGRMDELLAKSLMARGDPEGAARAMERYIRNAAPEASAALLLADLYVASGRPADAVRLLDDAIARIPRGDPRLRCVLQVARAVADYKSGNRRDAESQLKLLAEDGCGDGLRAVIAAAALLRDDGRLDEAATLVLDWLEGNSLDGQAAAELAEVFIAAGDRRGRMPARRILDAAGDDDSPAVIAARGLLRHLEGDNAAAEELYRRAVAIQPENPRALNNLAILLCEAADDPLQALTPALRGLELAPDSPSIMETVGMIYFRLGRYEDAAKMFLDSLTLLPDDSPRMVVSSLRLGRTLAAMGRHQPAAEHIQRALRLNARHNRLSSAEIAEANRLLEN